MLNKQVKISIIVPVYKVEQYLSKCIDSILSQTYQNWELLLIDDGSPDNSGRICDEYAAKDERIRVFHKKNGGVSSARNLGLDYAEGGSVMFVDSDDWLSNDCLEVCVYEVEKNKLDALQFGFTSITENNEKRLVKNPSSILDGEQYIKLNNFNVCVGGGVYKREIIEEYKLRFPEELKLAEDQIFVLSFFKHAQRIKYIDKTMYYYLQRADSAVHTPKSEDILKSCDAMISFSKEWSTTKSFIDSMIVLFIMDMIKNNDVPHKILKAIYYKQKVGKINGVTNSQRLFPKLALINFSFAYLFTKLYLRIRRL